MKPKQLSLDIDLSNISTKTRSRRPRYKGYRCRCNDPKNDEKQNLWRLRNPDNIPLTDEEIKQRNNY